MNQRVVKSQQVQRHGDAAGYKSDRGGSASFADKRSEAEGQRELKRAAQDSPHVVAQRQRLNSMFGAALQRKPNFPSTPVAQRVRGLGKNKLVIVRIEEKDYKAKVVEVVDDDHYLVEFSPNQDLSGIKTVSEADVTPRDTQKLNVGGSVTPKGPSEQELWIALGKTVEDSLRAIVLLLECQHLQDERELLKFVKPEQIGEESKALQVGYDERLQLLMQGFAEASPELFHEVMLLIYEKSEYQPLLKSLGSIQSTELHPLGRTEHTLSGFAELQLGVLGKLGYQTGKGMSGLTEKKILEVGSAVEVSHVTAETPYQVHKATGLPQLQLENICKDFKQREWEILGRTVIFYPHKSDKGHVAVKLAKKGEDLDELRKEAGMQRILNFAKQDGGKEGYEERAHKLGLDPKALKSMNIQSTLFPNLWACS